MSRRALLDWCPLCGEKLQDDFVATRLMHDRMFHPGYILAQMGIRECEHENKTCSVGIEFQKELPRFHLEFCDECFHDLPKEAIMKSNPNPSQNKSDGEMF
ncbi:hypothetical protein AAA799N04_01173 [Marine Group I thaumarchaeote SCGC AAA799-N04]|uniref:Uncharacterized protein n=1 Tax=Marine Group I thaumarchaeote SCGC AAA799-N04 TaxID=1502293 RepID=A0A081RMH8_9ARCH|nr:hypothetical protein AAA799N04_01173 [Marine Group I thaumarchaeote SCGC AAA799-N04]